MRQLLVYALVAGLFYFSEGKLHQQVYCARFKSVLVFLLSKESVHEFINVIH